MPEARISEQRQTHRSPSVSELNARGKLGESDHYARAVLRCVCLGSEREIDAVLRSKLEVRALRRRPETEIRGKDGPGAGPAPRTTARDRGAKSDSGQTRTYGGKRRALGTGAAGDSEHVGSDGFQKIYSGHLDRSHCAQGRRDGDDVRGLSAKRRRRTAVGSGRAKIILRCQKIAGRLRRCVSTLPNSLTIRYKQQIFLAKLPELGEPEVKVGAAKPAEGLRLGAANNDKR